MAPEDAAPDEMGIADVEEWLSTCFLPDKTELQERTLKTGRSMVIGDRCVIDYGLSGDDIIVCEFSTVNGDVVAENDVRIDNFCEINGDVVAGADAFIGEGVKIGGKLVVRGDLDIGDNVHIAKGLDAKGGIEIRSPMPVIVYLILYLMTLLQIEGEDRVDAFLTEVFGEDEQEVPLVVPPYSVLNMEVFTVMHAIEIGSGCRLHGNIRAERIRVGERNTLFGSLRSTGAIGIGTGSTVHGDVVSEGALTVGRKVHILGSARGTTLALHDEARVDGTIRAPDGVTMIRSP
ncbi:MAG: acyltransferase [Methanomicrobiales archaeon]|nr:acyltransferase [Methanomicrobiales archaeon]